MPATSEVNQVGKREDLSDLLVVADAKNTPVTSMMKKGKKPTKTIFDWPVGQIPDPDTDSVPDGLPVTSIEGTDDNRALLHGRVHKVRRTVGVSEMAEDVSTPAGIESEFKQAKAVKLIAVKRAIEAVFCGDQDSSLSGTTHTTRGLGSWINNSAQTDLPVPADYRTPTGSIYSGTIANLDEDDVLALMQSIYEQTGEMGDWDCPVGTTLKTRLSTFTLYQPDVASNTRVRTFFATLAKVLQSGVDIIKGDFGTMRLFPTLWNAFNNTTKVADAKRGYILKSDDLQMRANKLPGFKQLADDDSGPRGVISAIIAQQLGNPLQHGAIKAT